jgi:hypothetical protein
MKFMAEVSLKQNNVVWGATLSYFKEDFKVN